MKEIQSFQEIEKTAMGLNKYTIDFMIDDDKFINGYRIDLKTKEKTSIYGKDFNDELLELVYFKKPSLELFVFYGHKNADGIFGNWTKATRNDMDNIIGHVQLFPKHLFFEKPSNCNSTITKTTTMEDLVINCEEAKLLSKIKNEKTAH